MRKQVGLGIRITGKRKQVNCKEPKNVKFEAESVKWRISSIREEKNREMKTRIGKSYYGLKSLFLVMLPHYSWLVCCKMASVDKRNLNLSCT